MECFAVRLLPVMSYVKIVFVFLFFVVNTVVAAGASNVSGRERTWASQTFSTRLAISLDPG